MRLIRCFIKVNSWKGRNMKTYPCHSKPCESIAKGVSMSGMIQISSVATHRMI